MLLPLPLNFHKTFIPERRFIAALLEYAAQGKSGTYADIASDTGIPMGRSTGKVPAILDYAQGMGLIELANSGKKSIKQPGLTSFGRIVYLEDRMMGEPLTQWIAHLHLCLPDTGAKAWYLVFGKGRSIIGSTFTLDQLEGYLANEFGPGKRRTGPLVRTYTDDAALGRAHVLDQEDVAIVRQKAPLIEEYATGYAAFAITLIDRLGRGTVQVTAAELNERCLWFDSCLWGPAEVETGLALIEKTGYLSVDRQMRPWILEKKSDASEVWAAMYKLLA